MHNKKVELVIVGIIVIIIGAVSVFAIPHFRKGSELAKMNPLETQEIFHGMYVARTEQVNFFILKNGNRYVVVDAGSNKGEAKEELRKLKIDPGAVSAVLLTHTDSDHIAALDLFPYAEFYLSEKEVPMITGQISRSFMKKNKMNLEYDTVQDREVMYFGGMKVECISTPGHTSGSMCYLINNKYLFTGDVLALKGGKAYLFNSYLNMDDPSTKKSIQKLVRMTRPEFIFTAHHGYSSRIRNVFESWQ